MDTQTRRTECILKTLGRPSPKYYLLLAIAVAGLVWFFQAWFFQLKHGLIVTGLADWGTGGGVTWGVYIGSFIWWVGIAHGGILISAAVRLFRLESFKPVARLAELLTIVALSVAALNIILDLGRPERMVTSIIPAFPSRIHYSPLIWDVTVITLYFVMTGTYLLLTLRREIYALRGRLSSLFAPLYWFLTIWYQPEEDKKVDRMVWWLALGLIILAPLLLHGGVIPWLFALLPSMPGWYGAIQGPTFLSIALTSAFGAVTFIAYLFRRVYGWEDIIPDKTFFRLGAVLALVALLFLWLQLQQILVGIYAPPIGVEKAMAAKLDQIFFWLAIGLVAVSLSYLWAQVLVPSLFSVSRTAVAGLIAVVAVLLEKTLFIVEGLMYPAFRLYKGVPGSYWPTWVEFSSIIGAICIVTLFFMVIAKVIPVIEVEAVKKGGER